MRPIGYHSIAMNNRHGIVEDINYITNTKEFRNKICHKGKPVQEQN